jgi:thymidine kinase
MAKLYFYYAAMNAGKSTALLQSVHNYIENKLSPVWLMPNLENGEDNIKSRLGLMRKAIVFNKNTDLYTYIKLLIKTGPIDCIHIDEAQFLTKQQVFQLTDIVDYIGIPVLCYGLRTDFKGEVFEGSQYLLGLADKLQEIKTICFCGSKATMTLRVDKSGNAIKDGDQVVIGGNELYTSMCRLHHKEHMKLMLDLAAIQANEVMLNDTN